MKIKECDRKVEGVVPLWICQYLPMEIVVGHMQIITSKLCTFLWVRNKKTVSLEMDKSKCTQILVDLELIDIIELLPPGRRNFVSNEGNKLSDNLFYSTPVTPYMQYN